MLPPLHLSQEVHWRAGPMQYQRNHVGRITLFNISAMGRMVHYPLTIWILVFQMRNSCLQLTTISAYAQWQKPILWSGSLVFNTAVFVAVVKDCSCRPLLSRAMPRERGLPTLPQGQGTWVFQVESCHTMQLRDKPNVVWSIRQF